MRGVRGLRRGWGRRRDEVSVLVELAHVHELRLGRGV